MDFIDQIVIPPSENHVMMLKYIIGISMLLLIPFITLLMGSSVLSVYFNRVGTKTNNKLYIRFAKDIIEKLTFNKRAGVALGILPLISITFAYAQLLYQANTISLSMLALSVLLFIFAFGAVYRYRDSFVIGDVISSLKNIVRRAPRTMESGTIDEVSEYAKTLKGSTSSTGWISVLLLYLGAYIFGGCISLTVNPAKWTEVDNILEILFSWATIFKFAYLLTAAGSITGGAILFYFFKWQGGIKDMDEDYVKFIKNFGLCLSFFSTLILPVLIFLNILYLPQAAFSGNVFLYLFLVLVSTLILLNIIYSMIKNSEVKFASSVFVLIIVVFMFNILSEQYVFGNALEEQVLAVTTKAEEFDKQVEAKSVAATNVDPQVIFNTKCIACHRFDVRLVVPPYQETVPKYNGDVKSLANFIYSPDVTPKNPGYTAMPNQGLKKKEALAMAQWLMEKVGKK